MFRYTYAGTRIINLQISKGDRYRSRVMRTSRAPWQRYPLNSQKKKTENKKVVMNTKPNTNHAALATQAERNVEKKAHTHDTDSQKQANRSILIPTRG